MRLDIQPADVCLIVSRPEPTPFGRIASAFAEGFRDLGVRLDLLLIQSEKSCEFDGLVRRTGLGARPRSCFPYLVSYLLRTRPKVVIVTPPTLAPFALLAGQLTNIPVIPWEVCFVERDVSQVDVPRRARFLPYFQRLTYKWAAGFAAVSDDVGAHTRAVHVRQQRKTVWDLPNPIDIPLVQRAGEPVEQPQLSPFHICAAGRLSASKGFDLLIEALGECREELPQGWRLTILGEGSCHDRLAYLVRDLELGGHVEFRGRLDNPFPVIRQADLLVHPARWEGFGMVILEALSLGTPVLATDCPGGPKEILDHGRFGRLVASNDISALSVALVELARNPDYRDHLARIGVHRAQDYSAPNVAERMLAIAKKSAIAGICA